MDRTDIRTMCAAQRGVNKVELKKRVYRMASLAMSVDGAVGNLEKNEMAHVIMSDYCSGNMTNLSDLVPSFDATSITGKLVSDDGENYYLLEYNGKILPNDSNDHSTRFEVVLLYNDNNDNLLMELLYKRIIESSISNLHLSAGLSCRFLEENKRLLKFLLHNGVESAALSSEFFVEDHNFKEVLEMLFPPEKNMPGDDSADSAYVAMWKRLLDEQMRSAIEMFAQCRFFVEECCLILSREVIVQKSIFTDVEALSDKDIAKELCCMMRVVQADNNISEVEREAFRVMCKIMRVKHSYNLWNKLSRIPKNRLSPDSIKVSRKSRMEINDFKTINKSLTTYNLRGPLVHSIKNSLKRAESIARDKVYYSDRKWSRYAIGIFVVTAFAIYLNITEHVLHKEEALNSKNACNTLLTVDNLWNPLSEGITCFINTNSDVVKIAFVAVLLVAVSLGYVICSWYRSVRNYTKFSIAKIGLLKVVTLGSLICVAFIYINVLCDIKVRDLISQFFTPLCIIAMMLSIEWLIFMREKYSKREDNPSHSSILYLLVFVAVFADICIGLVELENKNSNMELVCDKLASAFLLGCICFFTGKFIDMYRQQQEIENNEMKLIVDKINKTEKERLNNGSANEE